MFNMKLFVKEALWMMARAIGLSMLLMPVASAQQLWFGPGDDLEVDGRVAHPQFIKMFEPNAPWQVGIAHVDVMLLRAPWFLRMPAPAVQQVISFLKEHKMALAVPLGFVSSDSCGAGIEGNGTFRQQTVYPREMKRLGVQLDYVVMDEPLYFGHEYSGKNSCHFSIEQVAESAAMNVKMIRGFYPNVKFVLVEPEQGLLAGPNELAQFLDAYKSRLGELPVAVRFDIAWGREDKGAKEWHHAIPGFVQMLKARGIGYGIIYNAGSVNKRAPISDAEWVASAKNNLADWKSTIGDRPTEIVVQTWSPNPARILPESDPTTMAGYLMWVIEHEHLAPRGTN